MFFGILQGHQQPMGAVFNRERTAFTELLEGDPVRVPAECLFLFQEAFLDELSGEPGLPTDIYFTAAGLVRFGWDEAQQGIDRRCDDWNVNFPSFIRDCLLKLNHATLAPRSKSKHEILAAFARLRLEGRKAWQEHVKKRKPRLLVEVA